MKVRTLAGTVIFSLSLLTGYSTGQTGLGAISGTVKDTSGAVLPGVNVEVVNEGTAISRAVTTDAEGRYSVPALNLGTYRVTATHEGFRTELRSGIELTVGREAIVDFSLPVGRAHDTVEVKGEAPLVESTSATLGSLVDEKTIRALPLNGRSYDQLALLQPGVILNYPGATGGSPFSYGTGKRFSVGGQRIESNAFLLDGTNIDDQGNGTPGGASGENLGVDTILEFKVYTNSFKAEYGRVDGSVISAITRSGTNVFHGTAFEYIRNSAMDARNYFDVGSSPPPFKRNQFGGVIGGPIKKDKTFFFAGYEGFRQGLGTTQTAIVPDALARQGVLPTALNSTTTVTVPVDPAIVPYLELYPLPNGRDFGDGTAAFLSSPTTITNEDNVMGRLDHQLNSKTNLFARYTFDTDSVNAPQNIPNFYAKSKSTRQYLTLQAVDAISGKTLNHFRFAFNRSNSFSVSQFSPDPGSSLALIPGQPFGNLAVGGLSFSGSRAITQLGPNAGSGATTFVYNVFEWGDDFSHIIGKHAFQIGTDIQRFQDNTSVQTAVRGALNFSTFTNFLAGKPASLQAGAPLGVLPYWGVRQSLFAVYIQDDYTVNARVTLNLGFRWETTTDPYDVNGKQSILPSPLATSLVVSDRFFSIGKRNFEPRFGIAWRVNESGNTVVRAGVGIYHNQILPWAYGQNLANPPFFGTLQANNPPFPNSYTALTPSTSKIVLKPAAPFLNTPVDYQYNLSLQQQIASSTVVEFAYAGNKANHLVDQREADPAVSTLVNGQPFYPVNSPRINPAWGGIRLIETEAASNYNSGTVTVRRQFSTGLRGQVYYSYARALDDASSSNNGESTQSPTAILDPNNIHRDWGPSNFNVKHAAVATFSYSLPFQLKSKGLAPLVNGWAIDGIGSIQTGQPFTARLASSVSRDLSSVLAERPNLNPGFSNSPTSRVSAGCTGISAGTPLGTALHWYDPCAFSLPAAGTYGNLGRNTIIGPGVKEVDLALEKTFTIREKAHVTFRAEAFNIFNHTNFGLPNSTPLASSGTPSGSAGLITTTNTSSRQLEMALRIAF